MKNIIFTLSLLVLGLMSYAADDSSEALKFIQS